MMIKHRGIYHDRLDAPFVGSLIFAIDCHKGCKGCCHADRRNTPCYEDTGQDIIQKVLDYKFSSGIILAGFEWSETPEEMLELIRLARLNNLEVIVYTHHTEQSLRCLIPELYQYKGVYVKYGEYVESLRVDTYSSMGVKLASTNQYIKVIS